MKIQIHLLSALLLFTAFGFCNKTTENFPIEAITNHGTFKYQVPNTGETNVTKDLQAIFDELSSLKDVSATIRFAPGIIWMPRVL